MLFFFCLVCEVITVKKSVVVSVFLKTKICKAILIALRMLLNFFYFTNGFSRNECKNDKFEKKKIGRRHNNSGLVFQLFFDLPF
jgi:hypothetical protein